MKPPEFLSQAEVQALLDELKDWSPLLDEIRTTLTDIAPSLQTASDQGNPKHVAVGTLALAQFFTFSSIAILIDSAHFSDAFSLLRVLYEGHLHLWHMSNEDAELSKKYMHLAAIQDWRIANEVLAINGANLRTEYYTDERLKRLRAEYDSALVYFNARPGKIPRNYTTVSNQEIAKRIDASEPGSHPFRQLMHVRLYSAGSEHIHRSLFGLSESLAAIGSSRPGSTKWILAPNPVRGVEAAWWSSMIVLDGNAWYAELIGVDTTEPINSLRTKVRKLAARWLSINDKELE